MAQLPYVPESASNSPMDQQYGLGLNAQNLNAAMGLEMMGKQYNYWKPMATDPESINRPSFVPDTDSHEFLAYVDVQHFGPNNVLVTVDDNGYVTIKGKHGEKKDEHGFIAREFTRRIYVPEDYDLNTVQCNLSCDGVLIVFAKKTGVSQENQVLIFEGGPLRQDFRDGTDLKISINLERTLQINMTE